MNFFKKINFVLIIILFFITFAQSETSWINKKEKETENVAKEKISNWITKKEVKENKKKLKEKIKESKSWISKKSKEKEDDIKSKLKKHKNIEDLPKAEFYFAAIVVPNEDEEAQYIYGYVNSDKKSELFKFNNRSYHSRSDGIAYYENKKNRCEVDSQVGAIGSTMMGEVILQCKNGIKMSGGFRQIGFIGKGDGVTSEGKNVEFEFFTSKSEAVAKLNDYKKFDSMFAQKNGALIERKIPKEENKKIILKPNGKYYALLIGNSIYDDKGWDQLVSPVNDIISIKKILDKSYKFEKIITVKNGTKKEIFNAFKELSKLTTTNDYVLVYYSGHGEVKAQQAYWIPKDGSADWGNGDWININELNIYLTEIKAHHLAVMVDSCYVGGKFKGTNVLDLKKNDDRRLWNDNLNDELNLRSRSVLSSGSTGRVSDTVAGSNNSRFALSFLNLLQLADRESIPLNMVSIAMNVRAAFAGNYNQKPYYYHPDTWQHGGGDFIFIPKQNLR